MAESRKSASASAPETGGLASDKSRGGSGGGARKETASQPGSSGDSMDELGKQGREAASQAQEQAVKLVDMARDQATTQVATQKERAAGVLGALGTALHDASSQVRQQDETAIADFVDMAADQVESLAGILKEQDIGQLIDTAQQFARRQPMLFLAAAVAVGIVSTRFLKSSAWSGDQQQDSAGSSPPSGQSTRSGTSPDFGTTSSATLDTPGYGASMASGGPGAGRQ